MESWTRTTCARVAGEADRFRCSLIVTGVLVMGGPWRRMLRVGCRAGPQLFAGVDGSRSTEVTAKVGRGGAGSARSTKSTSGPRLRDQCQRLLPRRVVRVRLLSPSPGSGCKAAELS